MGCTSSKYSSEGEAKGTTIVGLFYEGGILVAADSRSSNEKRRHKALQIKNNAVKMFPISSSIIAVMSGTAIDCMTMCESVQTKYITESKKNGDSVHYALVQMCAHLRGLPEKIKKDKAFGVLLAGWDEKYDLQLYRIFIKDGRVTNEQIYNGFAAMGSGSRYAESIVRLRYEFGKSNEEEVAEIALESLFNATLFDKFTGGTLRRYKVVKNAPYKTMPGVDPFDLLNPMVHSRFDSEYYTLRKYESRMLFVVYSTRFEQPIYTEELINHFRKHGGKEAVAAHLVVKKLDFYFHRVVFKSPEDAEDVWKYVEKNSQRHQCDTFELLKDFPYQLVLETDVPVYVNKGSEHLLQLIHHSK